MKAQALHPTSGYSSAEEWANTLTHTLGFLLSVAGLVVAVVLASLKADAWMITASAIYGSTLLILHLSSTLYHAARNLKWKKVFLTADHSSIYLLIAGTYTPFCLGPLRGPAGWSLFGIIWSLAITGILREIFRPKRGTWLSTAIYLAMGWLVIAFLYPLMKAISGQALILLLAGGLTYSLGVVFYCWHSLKYHHAIWHLFVVAGATCQFFAVTTLFAESPESGKMMKPHPAEQLMAVDKAFSDRSAEVGLVQAFLEFAAEDAVLYRNGREPIVGREAIGEQLRSEPEAVLAWEPVAADIAESEDLGYTRGSFTYTIRAGGDSPAQGPFSGHYISIWKRQPDGSWKWVFDTGITSRMPQ